MELLQCDICKKTTAEHGDAGWKKVENASRIEFHSLGELPIVHVCDSCWLAMRMAVR